MRNSIVEFFQDIWQIDLARYVIWATLLLMFLLVSVYVVQRLRGIVTEKEPVPLDDLTAFRELREEGQLNADEFKRLKKTISDKALNESKNNDSND